MQFYFVLAYIFYVFRPVRKIGTFLNANWKKKKIDLKLPMGQHFWFVWFINKIKYLFGHVSTITFVTGLSLMTALNKKMKKLKWKFPKHDAGLFQLSCILVDPNKICSCIFSLPLVTLTMGDKGTLSCRCSHRWQMVLASSVYVCVCVQVRWHHAGTAGRAHTGLAPPAPPKF